eukprot:CAMPEP_0174258202 /NCGR_PEP_ID=MMETSP0439-20130205/7246_1 /TAXON_ID=0 /ORGANISM="Stereomyxa ramosa, Strain Chinc5" /LENGTH=181 /DNA_ID=CAMNT_0015341625 /DNA_START=180 /DNA_END=725 /DNA_ORIENTATION=-
MKCISEELPEDVVVRGSFKVDVGDDDNVRTEVKMLVIFGDGDVIERLTQFEGNFAFTTVNGGDFGFCFEVDSAVGNRKRNDRDTARVSFTLETGEETIDYGQIVTKEHLEPLQVEARKIVNIMKDISKITSYLKKREARMRVTNESTNTRVMWLSIFEVIVVVTLSIVQTFYLHKYFKKRS